MATEPTIRLYNEFDHYYADSNGEVRAKHPDFHIFRLHELGDKVNLRQGPFKTAYYQFALGSSLSSSISVFEQNFLAEKYALVIFLPGQIIEWKRTGNWDGYVINVKESFLNLSLSGQVLDSYRFLHDVKPKIQSMSKEDYLGLSHFYELMLAEHATLGPENIHVIKNLMQVLLVYINRLITTKDPGNSDRNAFTYIYHQNIATRFRSLLLTQYQSNRSVRYYAQQLGISPGLLNRCVQQVYRKSAKECINEVVLLHAQTFLRQSDVSIKELAYALNFDDYSHFVKFFKGATRLTPAEYRRAR